MTTAPPGPIRDGWPALAWELLDDLRRVYGPVADADGRTALGAVRERIGELLDQPVKEPRKATE